ncbi:MAG: ferrous iron transporter B, partial [Alphaproteobacteria bacterium]|nr:ferrous iron transporter B [Alphaproteobacteria bacterium]
GSPAIASSFAGMIGAWLQPIMAPVGFGWQITVALIPGLAAREVAVSALGTVYAVSEKGSNGDGLSLGQLLSQNWSLATALSLLAWYVFAPQCLATLAVIRRETNSIRLTVVAATYLFVLAYLAAFMTYQISLNWIG